MNKWLLALVVLTAVVSAETNFDKFQAFISKYEKKYSSLDEFEYRFKVFEQNLDRISKLNAEHVAIGGEEVFGINVFADVTKEEFETRLMKNLPPYEGIREEAVTNVRVVAPADVDWRNNHAVTPVKDQGQCGSCWAHSADEAVESFYNITGHKALTVLSVEQCTACTYSYNGCNGGWPYDAYTYAIQKRNGIVTDASYPYNIATAGNCKFGTGPVPTGSAVTTVSGYKSVAKGGLQNALATVGPVSVCVAADAWQTYTGGVLKSCPGSVDHCVQAVGYTTSTTADGYWVVRNSWGTGWGEKGYIWLDMATNSGDICHIQEYITYPVIA